MMERETRAVLRVTLGLLVLLGATLGAAALPLGRWNLALALGFSLAKAALIGWWFMELRSGGGRLRLFAGAGFFLLVILAVLGLSDYLTRFRPL
jgi:caa(3)-type oxidase subunit IV